MKKWIVILVPALLVGCGEDVTPQATTASPIFTVDTQNELVLKTLPATRLACPGLNRYASDFQDIRVEQQYRTTIVFHIPERSSIPDTYKAGGHNCFIEIEEDGSAVLVEKLACKSVCLDRAEVPDGQLKLPLLFEEKDGGSETHG